MKKTQFFISEEGLPLLCGLTGEDPNLLSPWAGIEAVDFPGDREQRYLMQAGLLDREGYLRDDINRVIDLLSSPTGFVRLRFVSGPATIEQIIYHFKGRADRVLVSPERGGLRVSFPAPVKVITGAFREYWGASSLSSSRLKLKVDSRAGLVFAALADLHRRSVLFDRASLQTPVIKAYRTGEIIGAIEQTPPDGQWLVTAVGRLAPEIAGSGGSDVESSLARLRQLELVQAVDGGYRLSGEALTFGNSFLLVSQALTLEVGALSAQGEVVRSAMISLQAGLHDTLYLDRDRGELLLETVPASYIGGILETFLSEEFERQVLQGAEKDGQSVIKGPPPAALPGEVGISSGPVPEESFVYSPPFPGQRGGDARGAWFIGLKGKSFGPYEFSQIRDFVAEGRLQSGDFLWHEKLGRWTRASEVGGLFGDFTL